MVAIDLVFHVHQPFRLKWFSQEVERNKNDWDLFGRYFNKKADEYILKRIANKCYIPTNKILFENLENLKDGKSPFKVGFSITGMFLEQVERYYPELIESFRPVLKHKNVEILGETYYHSLSSLRDEEEFLEQVKMHSKKIKELFGKTPRVFRNTELIFNNEIAKRVEKLGFEGIFCEGVDWILEWWKSSNYLYSIPGTKLKAFLRNYRLSDDVGYRFSNKGWNEWPLTAEKYTKWLAGNDGDLINLYVDYETFGEHHWPDTGIHEFIRALPQKAQVHENLVFINPSDALIYPTKGEINVVPESTTSWADMERDTSGWLGHYIQHSAFHSLYRLKEKVLRSKNPQALKIWRYLQASDVFHAMSTKGMFDGDVHNYFSPYDSPYDAYANYLAILLDFALQMEGK